MFKTNVLASFEGGAIPQRRIAEPEGSQCCEFLNVGVLKTISALILALSCFPFLRPNGFLISFGVVC